MDKAKEIIITVKQIMGLLEEKYEVGFISNNEKFYLDFNQKFELLKQQTTLSESFLGPDVISYTKDLFYYTKDIEVGVLFLKILTTYKNKLINFTNKFEKDKIFSTGALYDLFVELCVIKNFILRKL